MTREGHVTRKTKETNIDITVDPDGTGIFDIDTGIAFLDHMLSAFAKHGHFDCSVKAGGDLEVDCHHLVEDMGIVLGMAIRVCIGDGKGIRRFAHVGVPMDDSLAQVTLDCGGRGYLVFRGGFSETPVGGIPGDLFEHFFYSLCTNAGITAHINFYGKNDHHKSEAIFKAFGIALSEALAIDPKRDDVPSTKGSLHN